MHLIFGCIYWHIISFIEQFLILDIGSISPPQILLLASPFSFHEHTHTHLISLQLEGLKLHGDAVLCGRDHLPHTVLVGWILFGPTGSADSPVQLGEETTTSRWKHRNNSVTLTQQGICFVFYQPQGQNCIEKKTGASSLTLWWEQGFPSSSQTTLYISGWCRIWSMLSHLFWQFTFLIHSC